MKSDKLAVSAAKSTVKVLNSFLRLDANSSSCILLYQSKAPQALERFKKKHD